MHTWWRTAGRHEGVSETHLVVSDLLKSDRMGHALVSSSKVLLPTTGGDATAAAAPPPTIARARTPKLSTSTSANPVNRPDPPLTTSEQSAPIRKICRGTHTLSGKAEAP